MIPKVIHYCWFGNNPLPEIAVKCINSWKKYCPDYEIVEWNEHNISLDGCDYVKEAYSAKKWAFVSDYIRFKVLYDNGGIYFDTDVELIAPIDDKVIKGSFMGREKTAGHFPVNAGLGIAFEAGDAFLKLILDGYENDHFVDNNGQCNMYTVVERVTDCLTEAGLKDIPDYQEIMGIHIYSPDVFCPYDYNTHELHCTDNSVAIHWYDASWLDEKAKQRQDVCVKIQRIFRGKIGFKISKIYTSVMYNCDLIGQEGLGAIVKKIKRKCN